MFQLIDPALVRAMQPDTTSEEAMHHRALLELRRHERRARLLGLLRRLYRSNRLRTRSTGVPSLSGTAASRP
jgi:hypothetical protein